MPSIERAAKLFLNNALEKCILKKIINKREVSCVI